MFDFNDVILTGRLTADPELKYTQSGSAICNFSLAVNRGKKKDSEEELPAYFFNCFAWAKTGENINKFFSKGRKILIGGQLEHQRWTDSDGSNRSTVKINVRRFQFMDSKGKSAETQEDNVSEVADSVEQQAQEKYEDVIKEGDEEQGFLSDKDDDIPF